MAQIDFNATPVLHGGDYDLFRSLNKTKKIQHVQELLKDVAIGIEFECELVARLIQDNHYFLKTQNIAPTRFLKAAPKHGHGGYDFMAYFADKKRWHPVSWRKSINGEQTFRAIFIEAARLAIQPLMRDYKAQHPKCELCQEPSEEVDHVDPEFSEIAKIALDMIDDNDMRLFKSSFDFFSEQKTFIPDYHPSIQYVIHKHKTTKLQAVCKQCHQQAAKIRKAAA